MSILVTGGAGYIGSHTVVELLNDNYEVIIIDNFSNSNEKVLNSIREITKKDFKFYLGDVCDKALLRKIFNDNKIDAVIHFAGYKAVGESVKKPLMYYENNLTSKISLCEIMIEFNCKRLVFSSSATVYGNPMKLPIKEDFPLSTTNPYGTTKLLIENILNDVYNADKDFSIVILRYFNPIGAHASGLIGDNPNGIPNNLMPYILKVASGELECLSVFGNDYDTKDGTGVRDYIHVVDLAKGHLKAIVKSSKDKGIFHYNLGTGKGYSVLDIINSFEKVNNIKINYKITDRRPGDIASSYADVNKSMNELSFKAIYDIDDMCRDSYNFILKNKSKN